MYHLYTPLFRSFSPSLALARVALNRLRETGRAFFAVAGGNLRAGRRSVDFMSRMDAAARFRGISMSIKVKLALGAAVLALGAWFYATPYLTVRGMQQALDARDAAKLSGYVDYPALRNSLKEAVAPKSVLELNQSKDKNPLAAMGAAIADAVIAPVVDAMVTPESLALMMRGIKPKPGLPQGGADEPATGGASEDRRAGVDTAMGYEDIDRFVVTVKQKEKPEQSLGLIFKRDGWFGWKLSAVRLPE